MIAIPLKVRIRQMLPLQTSDISTISPHVALDSLCTSLSRYKRKNKDINRLASLSSLTHRYSPHMSYLCVGHKTEIRV